MTTTVINGALATWRQSSGLMDRSERSLRAAMAALNASLEARSRHAIAIRQLRSLSDRELHDIGIDRSEISRAVREASFPQ